MKETERTESLRDSGDGKVFGRHRRTGMWWLTSGIAALLLQGCAASPTDSSYATTGRATAGEASQREMVPVYRPATDARAIPRLHDAEKTLGLVATSGAYHAYFGVSGAVLRASDTIFPVSHVRFESDAVVLELERGSVFQASPPSPIRLPYSSLKGADIVEGHLIKKWIGVRVAPDVVLWHLPQGDRDESMAQTKTVADAMYSLYKFMAEKPLLDAEFVEVARKYRASHPKPVIPEEVRRFSVIALNAVRERRFQDAAKAYDEGLKLARWWPEGQFNAALVYGELHDYEEAVDHMKKYVALVPEAPNARAAQDKIYVWESKLTR